MSLGRASMIVLSSRNREGMSGAVYAGLSAAAPAALRIANTPQPPVANARLRGARCFRHCRRAVLVTTVQGVPGSQSQGGPERRLRT